MASAPTLPPVESSESFNPDFSGTSNGNDHANSMLSSPVEAPASVPAPSAPAPQAAEYKPDPQIRQKVEDVLHSDIGVSTLLNRLKASIASARVCFFNMSFDLRAMLTDPGLCQLLEAPWSNRGRASC